MLCVVGLYLISRLRQPCEKPLITTACVAAFLLIAGASTIISLRHNAYVREDIIAFSQILYWVLVWLVYAIECCTTEGRRIVLRGVFVAGVYMAVSVIAARVVGGGAYSKYEGIDSSFGGFSTAKSLGGILCVAGLLSLRVKSQPVQIGLLCVSLTALMLTYQRAGQLAMLAAVLWLVGKRMGAVIKETLVLPRFIIAVACVLSVVALFVDREALAERWQNVDLTLGNKAGSGRLGLWNNALSAFDRMNWPSRMLGVGYSGMRDAMLEEGMGGNRKHTHSDVLDILLAFGLLGMLGWIGIHYAVIQTVRTCAKTSMEYVLGGAVYIVFFVESLITGQAFGPATMIVYLGAITGLCGAGYERIAALDRVAAGRHAEDYSLPVAG